MDIALLRKEFPQLQETVYGRPLVYLDNAATSLRPRSVIAKWDEMSSRYSANLHRAVHYTANVATEEFESARAAVAAFIYFWNTSEEFRQFWINLWEAIKSAVQAVVQAIATFFTQTIPEAFNAFVEFFKGLWEGIKSFFSGIWEAMKEMVSTA